MLTFGLFVIQNYCMAFEDQLAISAYKKQTMKRYDYNVMTLRYCYVYDQGSGEGSFIHYA